MSNGGSLWTDRLVNGESSNVNAAAAATGAVSGNIGEVEGGSCVGDGGGSDSSGGSSISSSSSNSSRSVSGVSCRIGVDCGSGSGSGSGDNTDCSGRSVPAVTVTAAIIGGTVGGASNGLRDRAVTLSDARGTTLAVNRCRETTVPRIRGGGGSAGDDNNDHVVATVDCHELGAIVSRVSSAGTIIPVNAGNVDYAQTVGNNSGTTANIATTAAAVVVVDTASTLFHDIADEDDEDEDEDDDGDGEDEDEENDDVNNDEDDEEDDSDDDDDAGDDDDDDDEEEDEDQDEEDEDDEDDDEDDDDDEEEEEEEVDIRAPRYRQKHGNMVAAMNEHLSSTTTTTTSSPASANGARTSGSTVATLSSSSVMMTTSAIVSGNMNPTAMSTTTSTVMSSATIGVNNSNSCNNTRNQEFQEMDGDDGKTVATTTTTTGPAGILSFPCDFDHMYASMTDGGTPAAATATAAAAAAAAALGVSPLRGNEPRQNDLTEVKHLKELLLLHLDLIQQQSEQIVTKDKLLAALRQENETLKLRLERMERRVNLQKLRSECSENSGNTEHVVTCSPPSVNSVNTASTSELQRNVQSESSNTLHESFKIRLNTSGGITTVKQEPVDNQSKHEVKQEANETRFEWEEKKKRRSDPTPLSTGSKKKRGLSCSSTVNTDVSSNIQDKILSQTLHEASRKSDRKAKSLTKKESFLTTEEHYYTAVGDSGYTLSLKQSSPVETCSSLEVPNWRVKIYTSCYTMEGTENLDDEIFNKRHLKLENDERRRKRWDVQRIREQRHIEKLKQRQERQNHQATCYNTNHTGPCPSSIEDETITSLWPDVEQIQSLQVDPHLPVTAFGAPIPSFTPSEFSLPWSNITRIKCRRPKRSTSRRRSTGRRKV